MQILLLLILSGFSFSLHAEMVELPDKVELSERHRAIDGNELFDYQGDSFEDYIEHEKRRIARSRTDLASAKRNQIIEGNAPFLFEPPATCARSVSGKYQQGILLSHGLTDSPYMMHSLARYFQSQCFVVLGILLPGHGTRPGDLLNVNWQEWVKAKEFGLEQASKYAENVYVGGFSTGGTLSLYVAAGNENVAGLMLFAPAVDISETANFAWTHNISSWLFKRTAWLQILPDDDPYKYESFSMNAVVQINALTGKMKKRVKQKGLKSPVFIAASWDDVTVDTPEAVEFFMELDQEKNRMLLFSQQSLEFDGNIILVDTHKPAKKLLGLAHIGVAVAPDDPRYGQGGYYADCKRYHKKGSQEYLRCKNLEADYQGEHTSDNLKLGVVQRISHNPWYQQMTGEIEVFLEQLQKP